MEIRTEVKNLLVPGDRYLALLLLIFKGPCLIDFSLDQRFTSSTANVEPSLLGRIEVAAGGGTMEHYYLPSQFKEATYTPWLI